MFKKDIIIDGLQYCKWDREYFNFLKSSGVSAVHITLAYHENARETLTRFAQWHRFFEDFSDLIIPISSSDDILQAKKQKKVGIFFGAQNCSPIDDEIGLISVMRQLGLLIMQLTYNNQSLLATGCYEKNDSGITRFGRQAIEEMNRVGMIIDMSHSNDRSTLEAIDISTRPICISHANPKFAHNGLRNKTDEVIKALAKKNGLIGLSLYPFHLPNGSNCTLNEFCKMAADLADMVGVDHIGIGSDLCLNQPLEILEWMRNGRWSKVKDYGEGSSTNAAWPKNVSWFNDTNGLCNIYEGLLKYGFSNNDVKKVMGLNWFNFLQDGLKVQNHQRG